MKEGEGKRSDSITTHGAVRAGTGTGKLGHWAGGTPTSSVEERGEDLASHAGTLIAVAVGG